MRLNLDYFSGKNTLTLAEDLLGKLIVHNSPKGRISGILCETEAYTEEDEACHAFRGKRTEKNEVMFWRSGYLYVYFTYGRYFCCNIVTGEKDRGEAVLIRGVIPIEGENIMREQRGWGTKSLKGLCDGPAKFAIAFGFGREHNGSDLLDANSAVYLEDTGYTFENVLKTPRIGISRAKELPWRFVGRS